MGVGVWEGSQMDRLLPSALWGPLTVDLDAAPPPCGAGTPTHTPGSWPTPSTPWGPLPASCVSFPLSSSHAGGQVPAILAPVSPPGHPPPPLSFPLLPPPEALLGLPPSSLRSVAQVPNLMGICRDFLPGFDTVHPPLPGGLPFLSLKC